MRLGRQLRSGRTQTVGVLLPHLDQPYFLHLLAGIEKRLAESNYMALLGIARDERQHRQAELAERMLARRVDALLVCPRPAMDLADFIKTVRSGGRQPIVWVDNYLPEVDTPRVLSDNRWGTEQAVAKIIEQGCRRVLFLGGNAAVAALQDRHKGYCDALRSARIRRDSKLTIWRNEGEQQALQRVRRLLLAARRPDAIFTTSFFQFGAYLDLLKELGLSFPADICLAGFDRPMDNWPGSVVRDVIRQPLFVVQQSANEMGSVAVDLTLNALGGENDILSQERLIKPQLSWQTDIGGGAVCDTNCSH